MRGYGVVHVDANGLMAEVDEYWDLLSLLKQLNPRARAVGGARGAWRGCERGSGDDGLERDAQARVARNLAAVAG